MTVGCFFKKVGRGIRKAFRAVGKLVGSKEMQDAVANTAAEVAKYALEVMPVIKALARMSGPTWDDRLVELVEKHGLSVRVYQGMTDVERGLVLRELARVTIGLLFPPLAGLGGSTINLIIELALSAFKKLSPAEQLEVPVIPLPDPE